MASRFEWLLGLLVFIVIFALAFSFLSQLQFETQKKYRFEASEQGIVFRSQEAHPSVFLKNLKDKNEFIIVLDLQENTKNASFLGSSSIMMQSILQASGKKVISLIREFKGEKLASCQTNLGSSEINKQVSAKECMEMMGLNAGFIILEEPDSSLKQSEVLLEKNKVFIKAKKGTEIQTASYLVLKTMFEDSEEKVKQINDFLKKAKVASG